MFAVPFSQNISELYDASTRCAVKNYKGGGDFKFSGYVNVNVSYVNKTKNIKLYLIKEDNFPLLLSTQ